LEVAYFGEGDQVKICPDIRITMGILEEKVSELGGETVGYWSTD